MLKSVKNKGRSPLKAILCIYAPVAEHHAQQVPEEPECGDPFCFSPWQARKSPDTP